MTTNAERALAKASKPLHEDDQPISEEYRIVALDYADADAAATLMEEMKSVTLEKMKSALIADMGDMPDNRAERMVKASPDWEQYIRDMCRDRAKATKLRLQLEYIRMRHREWVGQDANARAERRL